MNTNNQKKYKKNKLDSISDTYSKKNKNTKAFITTIIIPVFGIIALFINPIAGFFNELFIDLHNRNQVSTLQAFHLEDSTIYPLYELPNESKLTEYKPSSLNISKNTDGSYEYGIFYNDYFVNQSYKKTTISSLDLNIEHIDKIEKPVMLLSHWVDDSKIKFYIYNNGYGIYDANSLKLTCSNIDNRPILLSNYRINDSSKDTFEVPKIEPGEIIQFCEIEFDKLKLKNYYFENYTDKYKPVTMNISINVDNITLHTFSYFINENGDISYAFGKGAPPSFTQYKYYIDVDKVYNEPLSKPNPFYLESNNTENIRACIFPTKSCVLCFHFEYNIAGIGKLPSKSFKETITVPIFPFSNGDNDIGKIMHKNNLLYYKGGMNKEVDIEINFNSKPFIEVE